MTRGPMAQRAPRPREIRELMLEDGDGGEVVIRRAPETPRCRAHFRFQLPGGGKRGTITLETLIEAAFAPAASNR